MDQLPTAAECKPASFFAKKHYTKTLPIPARYIQIRPAVSLLHPGKAASIHHSYHTVFDISMSEKGVLAQAGTTNGSGVHGRTEDNELAALGYKPELNRNRSLYTILFQVLAITAVPFGEGTALISAIYGGGQLAYFVGWIVVIILDQAVAVSLGELASRFPTSSGPS